MFLVSGGGGGGNGKAVTVIGGSSAVFVCGVVGRMSLSVRGVEEKEEERKFLHFHLNVSCEALVEPKIRPRLCVNLDMIRVVIRAYFTVI